MDPARAYHRPESKRKIISEAHLAREAGHLKDTQQLRTEDSRQQRGDSAVIEGGRNFHQVATDNFSARATPAPAPAFARW